MSSGVWTNFAGGNRRAAGRAPDLKLAGPVRRRDRSVVKDLAGSGGPVAVGGEVLGQRDACP